MINLGLRLRCALGDTGVSQRELARLTGITEVTLSRYVNGNRTPKATTLKKIADALGVELDYFFTEEELKNSNEELNNSTDLISRQAAIDAILEDLTFDSVKELRAYVSKNKQDDYFYGGILHAINAVQDLSSTQPVARDTNVLSNDTISRQGVKEWLNKWEGYIDRDIIARMQCRVIDIPSAQPTLYGYDIKHLMLIAEVLRKENLPPERVTEALMDIGRIVSIVSDEFEESLREAMKQCKI